MAHGGDSGVTLSTLHPPCPSPTCSKLPTLRSPHAEERTLETPHDLSGSTKVGLSMGGAELLQPGAGHSHCRGRGGGRGQSGCKAHGSVTQVTMASSPRTWPCLRNSMSSPWPVVHKGIDWLPTLSSVLEPLTSIPWVWISAQGASRSHFHGPAPFPLVDALVPCPIPAPSGLERISVSINLDLGVLRFCSLIFIRRKKVYQLVKTLFE